MSIQKKSKRKMIKILFVQSIIFIHLFIAVDTIMWMFFPIPIDTVERVVTQELPGLKSTIVYKSRKYGLRSLSTIDDDKPNNSIRILCLGASTTNQSTQETQDTWCGILETQLLERYKPLDVTIQTMAFGIGGIRASDDAFWVKEIFDKIEPDIVITLLGINDLVLNGGRNYEPRNIEEIFSEKHQNSEGIIESLCKEYSQICRRVIQVVRNLRIIEKMKEGEVVEWHSSNLPYLRKKYQNLPYVEAPIRNPDPINEFRQVMTWMITFFKERKARVILLGQPVLWKDSFEPDERNSLWLPINTPEGPVRPAGAWLKREMTRYNLVQQSLASQLSTSYIDLDDEIPKTLDYYFDDCHFTDLGSRAVADNILPVLSSTIDDVILEKGLTRP